MDVSFNTSIQGHLPSGPPRAEDLASLMAKSVAAGNISTEQLQKNLNENLGVEDTSSIVAEDGSVDVAALTELLEANKPDAAAPPPPGPPPPSGGSGGPGAPEGSDITQLLSEIVGEDTLESVTQEDGSFDVEALLTALREQLSANELSDTGNLIDTQA